MTIRLRKPVFLVLSTIAILTVAVTVMKALLSQERQEPNIILVIVDALRSDHVGCYGYPRDITPNIDSIAAESLVFENAISQAPMTGRSLGSMLTSQYPESIFGLWDRDLPEHFDTLAEILDRHGYETSGIVANLLMLGRLNFDQGFDAYDDSAANMDISAQYVTESAVREIRRLKKKKFFLMLHYMGPHMPYVNHETGKVIRLKRLDRHPPYPLEEIVDAYDSDIVHTDKWIGVLIETLKSEGLYDNTMVVLISDHGEEFADHGGYMHSFTLYDELVKVVCMAKMPGSSKRASVNTVFPLINLTPSILEAVGIQTEGYEFRGSSVGLGTLSKGVGDRREATPAYSATDREGRLRSIRTENAKLILDLNTGKAALYDLVSDPGELKDVSATQRTEAAQLRSLLQSHMESLPPPPPRH